LKPYLWERGRLQACDVQPLQPGFQQLHSESQQLAEVVEDFVAELKTP
jgi:hypothetical protein